MREDDDTPSPSRHDTSGGRERSRPGDGPRKAPELPRDVRSEIERTAGPRTAKRVAERLSQAASDFDRGRLRDAERVLRPLVSQYPGVPAARELARLVLYRLGRRVAAARQLEAFRAMTGSVEQHPVLADCYRALGRWRQVEELWAELRAASPSAELVTEGRIVAAGAQADHGDLKAAIRTLEAGPATARRRRPEPHHLRLWYALADLYERAGDGPGARALFARVADADPDFADARWRAQGG